MKFLSCALACICFAPAALAADSGTTIKLPFDGAQIPASAKNADEAPAWNPAPAQSTANAADSIAPAFTPPANGDSGSTIPSYTGQSTATTQSDQNVGAQLTSPAQRSMGAQLNFTAPSNTQPGASLATKASTTARGAAPSAQISNPFSTPDTPEPATRELKSVMIRRGSQATNSGIVPATHNAQQAATTAVQTTTNPTATLLAPTETQNPNANAFGAAPPAQFVPDNPQPIPLPANQAPANFGGSPPAEYGVVPASNNVQSNWKSDAEPARYDQPLQLAPPPEYPPAAAVVDPPASNLRASSSTPELYAAPTAVSAAPLQVAPATLAPAMPTTSGVTPAAAFEAPKTEEPPVEPEKMSATRAAADLLAGSNLSPDDATFSPYTSSDRIASQVSLAAAIANVGEQSRAATIRAYWRLNIALRDYVWASDELKRLEQVSSRRNAYEGPMLSTARAAASARVEESKSNVVRAQATLESLAGPSIVPRAIMVPQHNASQQKEVSTKVCTLTDTMLVGPYRTYFDVLFANRPAPGRARELDRLLPIRWETINDRTAAVQSATSAVHYAEQAHAKGEADLRDVLACHEELHKQRRAFLEAVLDYNVDVADYALTVSAPGTSADKLVSMLIRTKQPNRVVPILPPTVSADTRSVPSDSPPRPTFGAPSRSDGWVASPMHSLETANRIGAIPRPNNTINNTQPNPLSNRSDPFANPVGDRYPAGDRYPGR